MIAIKDFGISASRQTTGPDSGDVLFPLPPYEVLDKHTVFTWKDQLTDAIGWIVIDHPEPTIAGGGLFMHSLATLQEVTDVASAMSYKLCVSSQPQVVGAKGGIRFDHRRPEASAVLERFVRDHVGVIAQYWGTGGDLNTSHATIDGHIQRYGGVSCALAPIARALSNPSSLVPILAVLKAPIPIANLSASLEEASVGYGAAVAFLQLLMRTAPHRVGNCRVALQGFGTVGMTFAHYVHTLGVGKIVGISSQHGFVVDATGIDVNAICTTRQARVAQDANLDPKLLETGLTLDDMRYTSRRGYSSDSEHLCAFLAAARANVFAPCAGRYVISPSVLDTLERETFADDTPGERFFVAGANNVFEKTQSMEAWLTAVDTVGVRMLPEWVTNSGTSNVFMRACAGIFTQENPEALLEASGDDIRCFLGEVERCSGGELTSKALFDACYKTAEARALQARTQNAKLWNGGQYGTLASLML